VFTSDYYYLFVYTPFQDPLLVEQSPMVLCHVMPKEIPIGHRRNVTRGQTQCDGRFGANGTYRHQLLAEPPQDDGPQSRVFPEAENRLHTCKAVMALTM
jgi:hypothetical protein